MGKKRSLASRLERINLAIGNAASWCALGLVLVTFANVVLRYALQTGDPWQQELTRFLHAILFLAAGGYALALNEHVRIDIFYQRFSPRRQAWVELLGTLLLLWPSCAALLYLSAGYVLESWRLLEASGEYRGMPGIFILKSFIWVFALTLALQGLVTILRASERLRHG